MSTNVYWSAFFLATGFHGLHVTGGLVAFVLLLGRTFLARTFTHEQAVSAVVVSYYWHFVDVVWIALFGVIYLLALIEGASRRPHQQLNNHPDDSAPLDDPHRTYREGPPRAIPDRKTSAPGSQSAAAGVRALCHGRALRGGRPGIEVLRRHRHQPAGGRGQGAVRRAVRLVPRAERRGSGQRRDPGPAAGRRRCRSGRVPGRHRPDADGQARPSRRRRRSRCSPRKRCSPSPRTWTPSAPARPFPKPARVRPGRV